MDKRMEEIFYNIENSALDLDDTFQFKCRGCGKCCKNREDILLTTRDLYNIAHSLSRTTEYIIDRYCDVYIGTDSRVPVVRLHPSGPDKVCPLLHDRKCIVHKSKPVVCALFPLGRAVNMEVTEKGIEKPTKIKPRYFVQPATCGTFERTQTLRSWLEHFGLPAEDVFFELWTEAITSITEFFRCIEKMNASKEALNLLWSITFNELYANYDPEKALIPQFRENMAKLFDAFASIREDAAQFFGGLPDGK